MEPEARTAGLEWASKWLVGARVIGFHVPLRIVLHFDRDGTCEPDLALSIGSGFTVSGAKARRESLRQLAEQTSFPDLWQAASALARDTVEFVDLGETEADLFVGFSSGRILSVAGVHSYYESWDLSVRGQPRLMVATPGGGLALWS